MTTHDFAHPLHSDRDHRAVTRMLRSGLNRLALLGVLRRRIFSHLQLSLAVWAGCTLAIGLVAGIPIYAEATGYRMLLATLAEHEQSDSLPPFAMVYAYGGARAPAITWAHYQQADQLASNLAAAGIALPARRTVRYAATEKLRVMFPDGPEKEVAWARLAFVSGFQEQVRLVAGAWPAPWDGSGPLDVLVSEPAANKLTLLVDDVYRLHTAPGTIDLNLPVRVAGIWRPIDAESDYWFYSPEVFSEMLIAPEAAFARALNDPAIPWVSYSAWYTLLDGDNVRSADVPRLIDQISQATAEIQRRLPGVELTRSPTEALVRHRDQVRVLTVTLALFSVPLLGLLGYFTSQMAGVVVQGQQQEIAVLRSRGSSRLQVLALALGEGLGLAAAALVAGVPLGLLVAQAMLWTRSFLAFAPQPGPPATLLDASVWHGALVAALVVPAIVVRGVPAARRTIVSYKQERVRSIRAPLWRRLGLDVLLLIPALYGYQQLRARGMISVPGLAAPADDPFRNPVLLLAPALLVFALALVVLRIMPGVLALLAWALERVPGVALLTAVRFLARTSNAYGSPLLLIILTLSLAVFSASMARTIDRHSADRARYRAGADVRLAYIRAGSPTTVTTAVPSGGVSLSADGDADRASLDYLFVPVEDYLQIPGVRAVTRAALSKGYVVAGGGAEERGVFLGVDRMTLPAVLAEAWRPDYAPESLGALMNRLADDPAAALISSTYAAQHGLRVGDRIIVKLNDLGTTQEVPFTIAGLVDYFPTLYAEEGPFVIGNLDYSFEQQGRPYPYEVWMDLEPGTGLQAIKAAAFGYGLAPLDDTVESLLEAERLRPERQGLFGLLSIGFLAAGLVTIIGFLAHTLRSIQRRLVELGVLRAIGMSTRQLAGLLIAEQALVIGVGTAAGIELGVLASHLFAPFLQVRSGQFPGTPPFVPQIAWDQIALIAGVTAALLMATVAVTLILVRRMRLFEALKLGEAV